MKGINQDKLVQIGYGNYFYTVDAIFREKNEFIELNIYSLLESTVSGNNIISNN